MELIIEKFGISLGYFIAAFTVFLRYVFFAGTTFVLFYGIWKHRWLGRKIQQKFPSGKRILQEVKHSATTAFVFALMGVGIYLLRSKGYTQIYTDFPDYGIGYGFFSFILLVLIHDTYFYWAHRLMHHPRLFMLLHRVHHESRNPTPWAALAFHPLEAIVEIAIIPLVVLMLPLHPLVLFVFASWSLLFNVMGHLGFELFPKGFVRHPVFKWLNTSTHHNMHHHRSGCNYGLYFNFWDRMMGTNHTNYERHFEAVTGSKDVNFFSNFAQK